MRYDLNLIHQLCSELGLGSTIVDRRIEVDLGQGALLCFENSDRDEDCFVGFLDMAWHTHDDLTFVDARGNYIELDYLDLIVGLKEGRVLVCDRQVDSQILDRWLIHSECNDEFRHLAEGECIIIRRAITSLGSQLTSRIQSAPPY